MNVLDRQGLVHALPVDGVVDSSVQLAACGRSFFFQRDGLPLEAQDEPGTRVEGAPTCLWCAARWPRSPFFDIGARWLPRPSFR